jgi:hypothetical protein
VSHGDAQLTAMYDQAKAASDEHLDLYLASVRKHTAGMPEPARAVTVSMALPDLPEDVLRDLLSTAIARLLAQ